MSEGNSVRCARCRETKPEAEFRFIRSRRRFSSYCLLCERGPRASARGDRPVQHLYVMDYVSIDLCKVGISANPEVRLGEARTFWPKMVFAAIYEVPDAYAAEQAILELHAFVRLDRSEVLALPARKVVRSIDRLSKHFGARKFPEYRLSLWERAVRRLRALFSALY